MKKLLSLLFALVSFEIISSETNLTKPANSHSPKQDLALLSSEELYKHCKKNNETISGLVQIIKDFQPLLKSKKTSTQLSEPMSTSEKDPLKPSEQNPRYRWRDILMVNLKQLSGQGDQALRAHAEEQAEVCRRVAQDCNRLFQILEKKGCKVVKGKNLIIQLSPELSEKYAMLHSDRAFVNLTESANSSSPTAPYSMSNNESLELATIFESLNDHQAKADDAPASE